MPSWRPIFYYVQHAKTYASFGSIGLLMQPIVATIFGALIFAEYLNLMQLGFVILALVGIYFARLEINPPNKEGHDELSNQSTRA